jgi:NOL1/NOP2/fmu family ribosome biogenesis protein
MKFIKSGEKKRLLKELQEQFGIEKLDSWILVETGKKKIRGFSGNMTREEIKELTEISNLELLGTYLVRKETNVLRLGFDATQILKDKIKKNIFELDDSQLDSWMNGNNLNEKVEKGIYVLRHADDFVGCGISNGEKIINFVPKERRIRRS